MKKRIGKRSFRILFFIGILWLCGCSARTQDGLDTLILSQEGAAGGEIPAGAALADGAAQDMSGTAGAGTDTQGIVGTAGAGTDTQGMADAPDAGTDTQGIAGTAGAGMGTQDMAAAAQKDEICYVHIYGAVKAPGVYQMKPGERVFAAVEAAGGFTEDACEDYVNQAAALADGLKIWIPTDKEAQEARQAAQETGGCREEGAGLTYPAEGNGQGGASPATGTGVDTGLVDINSATKEQLCTLNGIGEAKAEAILAYRSEHGAFLKKEDIMKVAGIKQNGYEKIKDRITVG